MSKIYICIGLKKKTCLGCFRIEEIRDNDNEISLKEGGVIKNVNYSASIRDARSLRLKYSPGNITSGKFTAPANK